MKRWTIRILFCLILGVVATVAVAWGCVVHVERPFSLEGTVWRTASEPPYWILRRFEQPGWLRVHRRLVLDEDVDPTYFQSLRVVEPPVNSWLPAAHTAGLDEQYVPFEFRDKAGWPAIALWCHYDIVGKRPNGITGSPAFDVQPIGGIMLSFGHIDRAQITWRDERALPLKPILPGFIINTLFYTAIWFVLFFGFSALRRTIRRKRGRCVRCGYDLRGAPLPSSSGRAAGGEGQQGCPECGWGR